MWCCSILVRSASSFWMRHTLLRESTPAWSRKSSNAFTLSCVSPISPFIESLSPCRQFSRIFSCCSSLAMRSHCSWNACTARHLVKLSLLKSPCAICTSIRSNSVSHSLLTIVLIAAAAFPPRSGSCGVWTATPASPAHTPSRCRSPSAPSCQCPFPYYSFFTFTPSKPFTSHRISMSSSSPAKWKRWIPNSSIFARSSSLNLPIFNLHSRVSAVSNCFSLKPSKSSWAHSALRKGRLWFRSISVLLHLSVLVHVAYYAEFDLHLVLGQLLADHAHVVFTRTAAEWSSRCARGPSPCTLSWY